MRRAIRQEYNDCSKWKRLQCHKVSVIAHRDRGTVCVVHVASTVDFDWTWEGVQAFRPSSIDDEDNFVDPTYDNANYSDAIAWSGEIVEVDERNSCLFLTIDNPERMKR